MPTSGGTGGFFLSLLTESFSVRALLGSLTAVGLAALVGPSQIVRSTRARQWLVLGPLIAAAVAGLASIGDASFLPEVLVPGSGGVLVDLVGVSTLQRPVNVLFLVYALVVTVLLGRRVAGLVSVHRLLGRGRLVGHDDDLHALVEVLSARLGLRAPDVVLLQDCPGGAFATRLRRPVIALDPGLRAQLDPGELEGLLAHELAHIARRDTLLCLAVGVFRDATFFLPPVLLAARWLRHEQEESADELAASLTRRPGALASGILKVWESGSGGMTPRAACAAVGVSRRLAWAPASPGMPTDHLNTEALALVARVERLLSLPRLPAWRRRCELALVIGLLTATAAAAIVVPPLIARNAYGLLLVPTRVEPQAPVGEAPAFATFRALAPEAPALPRLPAVELAPLGPSTTATTLPALETQWQLQRGRLPSAAAQPPTMDWRSAGQPSWEVPPNLRARELWKLTKSSQVGLYVIAPPGR